MQLHRTKGWRKPAGVVVVARPTKWGNPFRIGPGADRAKTVEQFVDALDRRREGARVAQLRSYPSDDEIREELAGRDLACWCPLDGPCHADVLMVVASRRSPAGRTRIRSRGRR